MTQTYRSSVLGTVYDANRAVIPGAQIKLISRDTGATRTTTTGERGEYVLSSLRPGLYRLEIAASGFATYPREFALLVNQELRVDAQLEPRAVTDPYMV